MIADPMLAQKPTWQTVGAANTVHDGDASPTIDRRAEQPRFRFPRPFVVVPVLPDGSPDVHHRVIGVAADLTADGEWEFHWENAADLATTSLIALVQETDGAYSAVGIDILSVRTQEEGGVQVIGRVGGYGEEILSPEKTMPTFDSDTLRFQLGFSEEMLEQWAAVGALQAVFVDKVQVCPRCESLPTYRTGCPNCGSAQLNNDRLIHHFACAHVGRVADFESEGGLVCPKCRQRHLIVASDFDYVMGPYRCGDCRWSNVKPEEVAQCLGCQFRFPAYQADTKELKGYRANRLDPLAYLAAS